MSPSAQKATGTTRSGKRRENGGFARQPPGKQPHSAFEGEVADEHPKGSTESNPGRCGPHLCQDVGARNSCYGAVPSLWPRERRSGPSLLDAHIREKAPQHANVEEMHPTYRDMLLVQRDGQILEWAKNNRNNEVAAIAAAKEMRSRVEDRRSKNEGEKISTGKGGATPRGILL